MIKSKIKQIVFFHLFILLIPFMIQGQKPLKLKSKKAIKIAFYNVDHFYDTLATEGNKDTSYLPNGSKKWDSEKYNSKLIQIANVLDSLHDGFGADIMGLTGFQNENVLNDIMNIVNFPGKRKFAKYTVPLNNYKGLMTGIIYDSKKIKVIDVEPITMKIIAKYVDTIENIGLWMKVVFKKDTIHFITVKFPEFGANDLDYNLVKRFYAAVAIEKLLKDKNITNEIKMVLMGDFSETPFGRTVRSAISTSHPDSLKHHRARYPNLMYPLTREGAFTIIHNGEKLLHDQFITTASTYFDHRKGMQVFPNSVKVFAPQWLKSTSRIFPGGPTPTFAYNKWNKTPSGHFPIMMTLYYAKKRKTVNK